MPPRRYAVAGFINVLRSFLMCGWSAPIRSHRHARPTRVYHGRAYEQTDRSIGTTGAVSMRLARRPGYARPCGVAFCGGALARETHTCNQSQTPPQSSNHNRRITIVYWISAGA